MLKKIAWIVGIVVAIILLGSIVGLTFVYPAVGLSVIAVAVSLITGLVIASPFVTWILAKKNILVSLKEEGKIKAKIQGGKIDVDGGGFIFALDGYRMLRTDQAATDYNTTDPPPARKARQWEVVPGEVAMTPEEEKTERKKSRVTKLLNGYGIEVVGLWPISRVYTYLLTAWTVQSDGSPKQHNELTDFVYAKRVAYHSQFTAQTHPDQGIEIEIEYIFYLRCVNPYLALFGLNNWYVALSSYTNALGVRFVGSHRWEEINTHPGVYKPGRGNVAPKIEIDPEKAKKDEFNLWLASHQDVIWEKFGFVLEDAIIVRKKGANPQAVALIDSFAAKGKAEQDGQATVIRARKSADAQEEEARGKAALIEKVGIAEGIATEKRFAGAGTGMKVITESLNGSDDWRKGLGAVAIAAAMTYLGVKSGQTQVIPVAPVAPAIPMTPASDPAQPAPATAKPKRGDNK